MKLAVYTFGVFKEPADHPLNDSFSAYNDPIFAHADQFPGFIKRSGYASDPGPSPWGDEIYPRFYEEKGDGWCPATLSLWEDLESLFHFTYYGLHGKAFKRGHEWFIDGDWPPFALWWIEDHVQPLWQDGAERLEYLHDNGATPIAFNLKQPFDKNDQPTKLDKSRVKELREAASS